MKVAEESDSAMAKDFHIVLDELNEQKVPWAFPMHLSILCPTTPCTGIGGGRQGIVGGIDFLT